MSFLLTDYRIRLASLPQLSNSFHHNYLTDTSVLIRTCLMWSQSRLSHWPISVLFTNVTLVELQSHFLPFICWWYTAVLFFVKPNNLNSLPYIRGCFIDCKKMDVLKFPPISILVKLKFFMISPENFSVELTSRKCISSLWSNIISSPKDVGITALKLILFPSSQKINPDCDSIMWYC